MVDSLGFSLHRLDAGAFQRFETAFLAESLDDSNSRNLLSLSPAVRSFASSTVLRAFTGHGAFPVCARLFNKNPAANWLVPWHQDLTIRVRERRDVSGYGPWSIKDRVHHVQPPVGVLEGMLAIRIHLDSADSRNGGLRVLPGTHRFGRIPGGRIAELAESIPAVSCDADRGEALCMRPLLLHASSRSVEPRARRVIHIEYATCQLDGGLEWLPLQV
jgi:ectoine hydroxylase-related dioxygenase (phytanoyl-CoA dioxygenase family)